MSSDLRLLGVLALLLLSPAALAGKKPKKPKKGTPPPVLVGWQTQEGWSGSCYYPPAWGSLSQTDLKSERQKAMDAMVEQWGGKREDGVSFDEDMVLEVETVLLGRPDRVEAVSLKNLEKCRAAMAGGGTDAWQSWVGGLKATLTEGECKQPLDYTMFDYLDIGTGWQRPLYICAGESVRISGSPKDKYRIVENGPWINVAGDPAQSAVGTTLPCNTEGCFAGQLIMKFKADSGWEKVEPVGQMMIFTAPEHGEISYRINDESFFDNSWFKNKGLIDHTAIEVSPAQ